MNGGFVKCNGTRGIYVSSSSSFTMTAGTINYTGSGYAVYNDGGSVEYTGGTINGSIYGFEIAE